MVFWAVFVVLVHESSDLYCLEGGQIAIPETHRANLKVALLHPERGVVEEGRRTQAGYL